MPTQCHQESDGFAYRLNGELGLSVTHGKLLPIHRDHADAEVVWIGFTQLGDVSGDLSVVVRTVLLVKMGHEPGNL
jgi:hypothetical protein